MIARAFSPLSLRGEGRGEGAREDQELLIIDAASP
jgi:hypothetical protein